MDEEIENINLDGNIAPNLHRGNIGIHGGAEDLNQTLLLIENDVGLRGENIRLRNNFIENDIDTNNPLSGQLVINNRTNRDQTDRLTTGLLSNTRINGRDRERCNDDRIERDRNLLLSVNNNSNVNAISGFNSSAYQLPRL